MKKLVIHSVIALVMVILAIIVHSMITGDSVANAVTTFRLYTMLIGLPGGQAWASLDTNNGPATINTASAPTFSQLWNVQWPAPGSACAQLTNLSTDSTCLAARQLVQTSILTLTNCATNRSQACNLINRVVSGLAFQSTYVVTTGGINTTYAFMAGRRLGTTPDGQDPKEYMRRTIASAPLLLHNAYRTSTQDGFSLSAPALYLLIVLFVALNVWNEVLTELGVEEWTMRWGVRTIMLFNLLPVLGIFIAYFVVYGPGSTPLLLTIFFPTALVIIWYFQMLPRLQRRPFIRPFVFCVVYAALTLLALLFNGVRRYEFVLVELLKAMGTSLIYMGLCWYFLGLWEKLQNKAALAPLYNSREAHTSVLLSAFVMAAVPYFTWLAPYNYTFASPVLLAYPAIFSVMSLFCLYALHSEASHQDKTGRMRHKDLVSFLCGVLVIFTLGVCSRGGMDFINVYLAETRAPALPMGPSYIQYAYNQENQLGKGLPST